MLTIWLLSGETLLCWFSTSLHQFHVPSLHIAVQPFKLGPCADANLNTFPDIVQVSFLKKWLSFLAVVIVKQTAIMLIPVQVCEEDEKNELDREDN